MSSRLLPPRPQSPKRKRRSDDRYPIDQCALYKLESKGRLAKLLGFNLARLQELAASRSNYKIFKLPKSVCPFIGKIVKERWVQEPKAELRSIHERLRRLISGAQTPEYAHGAIIGRSYRSNAIAHKHAARAATFDIQSFYQRTKPVRVFEFYRKRLHCSPDVALLLTKLSCVENALPTGSPLSPILSLHANSPLFDGLDKLAKSHNLVFTCYVDDLAFSGRSISPDLVRLVRRIVENNGHLLSDRKTKIFGRLHGKHITGVVLKDGEVRVPHTRFLKARAVTKALGMERGANRIGLQRKLAGLLAEAAHLDGRFKIWARRAQQDLQSAVVAQAQLA